MSGARRVPTGAYLGVLLVSAVALGLEILMTRILALMMWHHLTYVVIGVALLGFGAAGSRVMVRAARRPDASGGAGPERSLARASLALALSIPISYLVMIRIPIEPLALSVDPWQFAALFGIYALIAVPFYFGGIAICEAIRAYARDVGSVYFVDLLGAGLGVGLALLLLGPLTGPGAVLALAALGGLAATSFALAAGDRRLALAGVGTAALLGALVPWARTGAIDPPLAPEKELAIARRARNIADGVDRTFWSPLARIDVSEIGIARPLMGGSFPPDTPLCAIRGVFQDGTAPTVMIAWDGRPEPLDFLRRASAAAGHVALRARGVDGVEEMAIGVGGGVDLLIGILSGAKRVTGVEINPATARLLTEHYADFVGELVARDDVELVNDEGRHYARASGREFDLIQLSGVDTYTALSTDAYTLSESYHYTREGIEDFLAALRPEGVLCYSRIVFIDQPRETLRLAATAAEALEGLGVKRPESHLYVLGSGSWASLLVSKKAFEPEVLDALRALSNENGYLVLFDPELEQPSAFDECLRSDPEQREAFYADYPFDVRPATDDEPFFFDYFKWSALAQADRTAGHAYELRYPLGNLCLLLSLLQTVLLGALFILWPLRALRGTPKPAGDAVGGTWEVLGYFSALGLGFIAVEVALMQKVVLFLGHPTWSLATVLPTMLIGAGLGSLTVRPGGEPLKRLRFLSFAIPLAIVGGWLAVDPLLEPLLHRSLGMRVAATAAVLAPVGFVLGMAFPSGVQLVERRRPELVPWAWAVNAFTTVLGSTGTVLVALELGFSRVLLLTVPIYLIGLALLRGAFTGEDPVNRAA